MSSTITYRGLQDCDVKQVKEMLHNFFFDPQHGDPIAQVLKYEVPRETRRCVEAVMPGVLLDGLSVVSVKEESGEVGGFVLCNRITPNNSRQIILPSDDKDTRKMRITFDVLDQAQGAVDVCSKFQVSSYVYMLIIVVKPDSRRLANGARLVEKTLDFIKANDETVVVAVCTSMYSRRMLDELGFETLCEIRYHDYMMDGERLCSESGINGHKMCSFCAKRL